MRYTEMASSPEPSQMSLLYLKKTLKICAKKIQSRSQQITFKSFLLTLSFFVIFFSLISFYSDYKEHDLGGFCFSSICIKNFTNTFTGGLRILENGIKYIALLAAISGAMIALNNYKLSLKTSSLTSHISHLSLFQNYIET